MKLKNDHGANLEGNNAISYDGDAPFCDKVKRASRVEGYAPYGLAVLPGDAGNEDGGFLEDNNVRSRI